MSTITTRSGKGSPLTHDEVDSNFTNLNTDKYESGDSPSFVNIAVTGTVDGRDIATDGTKLDGIEASATADQTAAEIKTAYESNADTNAFTDADHTKLDGIEASATADQTAGEIKTAYESNADTNAFTDADHTKLDGIEASADVTDTANVTAAGALMDSELTSEASVKALDQGVATTDSPSFAGLTVDTNTLYVDSTNNRVGIGTSSPSEALHVKSSDATFRLEHNADPSYFSTFIQSGDSLYISAHTFRIRNEAGTENIRITNTGNVGIGTTNPTSKLEILDNTDIDMNGSGTGHLEIDGNGYNFAIALNASGANLYTNSASRDLIFGTNETERMRIDGSGNVGIGTTSPSRQLHIKGSASAVRLEDTDQPSVYHEIIENSGQLDIRADHGNTSTTGNMLFSVGGSEYMRIDSAGNVGIGTTNPAATVDVSGNARGAVTTDNDLSFDLSVGNNFSCTPTGAGTLTFTNHLAGQSGFVLLDNSGGHAIAAAATTKINAADLTAISTAGVYTLSYFDNGTNAYVSVSRSFA